MSAGNTRRAPCPQCNRGAKDRALAITTDERGVVQFCHRCGYQAADNHRHNKPPVNSRAAERPDLVAIWARTIPLRGTLGETYLKYRRCALPPADSDLRFLSASDRYPPSLCALVTNAITAEPMTLHFTRLRDDGLGKAGTDRDKLLLRGHPKAGGVIRLWPDADVRFGLGIAEGIETALSAAHGFTPVWATVDAGNMASFPLLDVIEAVVIFADNDLAGLAAGRAAGRRWASAGREAWLVIPDRGDVNDAVAA